MEAAWEGLKDLCQKESVYWGPAGHGLWVLITIPGFPSLQEEAGQCVSQFRLQVGGVSVKAPAP